MTVEQDWLKETQLDEQLEKILALLGKNEIIQNYFMIKEKVKNHQGLEQLAADIKAAQQEAVKFAHYGKPVAEKAAIQEAERLTKQFDEHPLVLHYRACLIEANDLLQYLTKNLERQVNKGLEEKYQLAKAEWEKGLGQADATKDQKYANDGAIS